MSEDDKIEVSMTKLQWAGIIWALRDLEFDYSRETQIISNALQDLEQVKPNLNTYRNPTIQVGRSTANGYIYDTPTNTQANGGGR